MDILSQINFNLEDRFRQNIVGSFSFICLCPLFVFQTTRTKYEWSQVVAVISDLANACKPVPSLQKVQLYSFTLQTSSSCVNVVVRCTVGEE